MQFWRSILYQLKGGTPYNLQHSTILYKYHPEKWTIVHEIQDRIRNNTQHKDIVSGCTPYDVLFCAKLELVRRGC